MSSGQWFWRAALFAGTLLAMTVTERRGYNDGVLASSKAWAAELSHFDCIRKN